ncbi:nitrate ABC transporter substrate-binding protein [Saccharospirillum salsuginis]|uniref:Outer membrane protein OmpA n=1 Tax=Saccharospirillum salsuginis TaxID=418750 RepID=A0A918KG93_9GAMM|nr:nitrate ABC transporter substrate-binding protein [Saccharospirillum salsuginis]GGX62564.1 hypothetical protein GCM10007392_33080 [Saccharospirillum salsuginis]
MKRKVQWAAWLTLALPAAGAQAVEFVDAVPLAQAMDPTVQECRQESGLNVPMRSNGADIVPLYANDYQLSPADGSLFADNDVSVTLHVENDIREQLKAYLSCDVPILRGTQGMLNAVADLTEQQDGTRQVAIYQHGYSNGGDALVSRANIQSTADLSGATIVTQAYGPHLSYLTQILDDAREDAANDGQSWQEPEIRYTEKLVGFQGNTPGAAFLEDDGIDAAFVITADARILTSGGNVGSGAEGSVKGAEIMLSTKSANRMISEVYVVRADYLENNRQQIEAFVKTLFSAEETVREDVVKQVVDWEAVGEHLLNDSGATDEAQQMWRDVETVGLQGNVDWSVAAEARSFKALNDEIQNGLVAQGLMASAHQLKMANWDYDAFAGGVFDQRRTSLPGFDNNKASSVVEDMKQSGELDKKALMEFEINFEPNQTSFSAADYQAKFNKVLEVAATYGGAVITVEGHSDPLNYLKMQHNGATPHELRSVQQAAKNLSMNRAIEVRDTVLDFAEEQGQTMDESQFVTLGHGIQEPKTGMCGGDPCPPKTQAEWLSNMRVTFRIVNVEAEASTFTPINAW